MGYSCVDEIMRHYLDKQSLYSLFPITYRLQKLFRHQKGAFILLWHIALAYIFAKIAAKTSC